MTASEEERWKRAFEAVTKQLNIENLLEEQQKSLCEFLRSQNIFANLPTGFGKLLSFQYLPIAADALFERPRGSSVVVVISPFRSLMEDQVHYLNSIVVPTTAIMDEYITSTGPKR